MLGPSLLAQPELHAQHQTPHNWPHSTPTNLQTRSNALAWNPMEAFNFTAANEDCCLYTFDMRKLSSATCVHKVGPTGGHAGMVGTWSEERGWSSGCPGHGKASHVCTVVTLRHAQRQQQASKQNALLCPAFHLRRTL